MPGTKDQFVEVRVITTAGSFPKEGFERAPINQPIKVVLKEAEKNLKLAGTDAWVALAADTELNVSKSYVEHGLTGQVCIDYGPREGGGGYA